jgi:hypothetical protein
MPSGTFDAQTDKGNAIAGRESVLAEVPIVVAWLFFRRTRDGLPGYGSLSPSRCGLPFVPAFKSHSGLFIGLHSGLFAGLHNGLPIPAVGSRAVGSRAVGSRAVGSRAVGRTLTKI